MATYLPIEEHGIVGDLRTVALVGTDGTVDWYCPARFDAPSLFASLLDAEKGGYFSLTCRTAARPKQLYLPDTNILTTTFHRAEGTLVVTDFMPCFNEGERFLSLKRICRGLEARGGPVEVECILDPAPAYGRARTSFAEREAPAYS